MEDFSLDTPNYTICNNCGLVWHMDCVPWRKDLKTGEVVEMCDVCDTEAYLSDISFRELIEQRTLT